MDKILEIFSFDDEPGSEVFPQLVCADPPIVPARIVEYGAF